MLYHYIWIKIPIEYTPPYFIGSMLRGAFGHALKRVTCINPSYQCEGCFSSESCLYYQFYEKQNIQHQYRFDIALDSKSYSFGLYLFDGSCTKLPYILSSLEMALTKYGLGRDRIVLKDIEIEVNGMTVYAEGQFTNAIDIESKQIDTQGYSPNLKIQFITPLRIKKSNQLEYRKIRVEHILRSIHQRQKQIFDDTLSYSLDYEPTYTASVKALTYKPLYRKSDRQGRKIIMDGVLGEMAVVGLDQRSFMLLKIGEVIGVGKQVTFGMGKIKIEEVE